MKKFTKIIAGVAALVMSLSFVGCNSGKSTDHPDFIHSSTQQPQEESEKYTINVTSEGGYKLDGVRVTAFNASGVRVKSGISSKGVINLGLTLGEYTLVVDEETLPAGYYLNEGVTYKTNPTKREAVDIKISSSVIKQSATADKVYALGEIANDFVMQDYRTYDKDYSGVKTYRLSSILKEKKAVVLNFWYPGCTYCTQEFPYLQDAYASQNDVEVLGICLSSYSREDVADYVRQHKNDFELTFPLGIDPSSLTTNYYVNGCPTTVVIDRYGMFTAWEEGGRPNTSFWENLFAHYSSDGYTQNIEGGSTGPGGSDPSTKLEKPNVKMPSSAEMAAAANAPGLNATYREETSEEYAWPWTVGTDETYGQVITVTNTGKQSSYATLHVDIELKQDDLLSFDYYVSSEENKDKLYVLLDGQLINADGWSGQIDWTSENVYVADRDKTVELSFIYMKNATDGSAASVGKDTVRIKNIRTSKISADTEALDVIRDAASGKYSSGAYEYYANVVLGSDGFYHVGSADGPLLYMSISNITPWSAAHTNDNKIDTPLGKQYASLYDMTFYKYSESIVDDDGNMLDFTVNIGDTDFAEPVMQYHHMLDCLEKPYQLMPVTEQLKAWAEAFTKEYAKEKNTTANEKEWLEFCFYYNHYGKPHGKNDYCRKDTDITKGLTIYNSYDIGFKSTPADGESVGKTVGRVTRPLTQPNGIYYKFTAPADGVYQFRDYMEGSETPILALLELKQNGMDTEYVAFSDGVPDFGDIYGGGRAAFNTYVTLDKGQTVYLNLRIAGQMTGDFTFDIIYHSSVDKLMDCSIAGGAWTYDDNGVLIYLGIQAAYDPTDGKYYHADANGEPDRNRPVYINMIYSNYFMSDKTEYNSVPIATMIDDTLFKKYVGVTEQNDMVNYLDKALNNTGDFYGLVEADENIVRILNQLISKMTNAGDNRGWMCFACYMEHYKYTPTQVANGGNLAYGWNEITSITENTGTATFTAPDAGIYSFGVPEGGVVSYNGGNLEITDGVAKVLLFKGEQVTVTVNKDANGLNVPVSVFKSVNMHETADGDNLDLGNNIISKFENGSATLTFTAEEAGSYEIDLSKFNGATAKVDDSDVTLTEGIAKVNFIKGQKITVTVSDPGERIIFTVKKTATFKQVNDGEAIAFGNNIIGTYAEDGTATVTFTAGSEAEYVIKVANCNGTPVIKVNGTTPATVTDETTVKFKNGDVVEISVKKGAGYENVLISVDYPEEEAKN